MRGPRITTALLALVLLGSVLAVGATGSVSAAAASSDDPDVAEYAAGDGVVDTDGLRTAIDHWHDGTTDTDLLREVIDAWRSGEPVETAGPVENVDQGTSYETIQEAVYDAIVGDTLELEATTFEEDVTVDVEGLTLRGSDAGTSTVDSTETGISVEADDVTLEGLTIAVDGEAADEARGVVLNPGSNDVSIVDNAFVLDGATASDVTGLIIESEFATVEGNTFDGTTDTSAVSLNYAYEPTIEANEFTGGGTGVSTHGVDVRLEANAFTDVDEWSVHVDSGTTALVNNSIDGGVDGVWIATGSEVTVETSDLESTQNAVRIDSASPDVTIAGNAFVGNDRGIYVDDRADPALTDVRAVENTIVGNDEGIDATGGTGTLDATENWWGDADGPSGEGPGDGDSVTVNVAYDPWLEAEPSPVIVGSLGTADVDEGQASVTQTLGAVDGGDPLEIDFGPQPASTAVVRLDLSELPATYDEDYRYVLDEATIEVDDGAVSNATVTDTSLDAETDEAHLELAVEDRIVTIDELSLAGLDTRYVVTDHTHGSDVSFEYEVTLASVAFEDGTETTAVDGPVASDQFDLEAPALTLAEDGAFDPSLLSVGTENATQQFGHSENLTVDVNRDDVYSVQLHIDLEPLIEQGVDIEEADTANVGVSSNAMLRINRVQPTQERAYVRIRPDAGERTVELTELELVGLDLQNATSADSVAYDVEIGQASLENPDGTLTPTMYFLAVMNTEPIESAPFTIEPES